MIMKHQPPDISDHFGSVKVVARPGEDIESMLGRFKSVVKAEGRLELLKEKRYFKTKAEKRALKSAKARKWKVKEKRKRGD